MTTAQEILQLQEDNLDLKIEMDKNEKLILQLESKNSFLDWKLHQNFERIQKLMPQHDRQNSTRSV